MIHLSPTLRGILVWLPLLLSFGAALLTVPVARWLSFRLGRVKQPSPDRWHTQPTPTLGGIGIFLAFLVGLLVFYATGQAVQVHWSLLICAIMAFSLGLFDDLRPLNPPVKLVGQLAIATVFIFYGNYTIHFFRWPIANILLTFFWLVGITNALNLLDNMDGLAGGVAFITAGFMSYFSWQVQDLPLLVFSLAVAGAALGFLVFNFPPARIFMGDSGSMFLGFSLAALAVARRTQASNVFAIMGVPTLLFLLPILDTTLVTITRPLRGQSPTQGGRDHTSHRLISFGLSERQAVLALYGVAIIAGISAAALEALNYDLSLALIPAVLIFLALFAGYLGQLKVVTPNNQTASGLSRLMIDLAYRRRIYELLLDLALVAVSYYVAFWTLAGLHMTRLSMNLFLRSWPLALALAYLFFYVWGVYRGVWHYFGFYDLGRYVLASTSASTVSFVLLYFLFRGQGYSLDVFLLYTVFLLIGLVGSRSSFVLFDRLYNRQQLSEGRTSVLLYGAGDPGEMALRWIQRSPGLDFQPVGFLEEDAHLWGRSIHGVPILGGSESLEKFAGDRSVGGVIFTSQIMLESEKGQKLLAACREKGLWTRLFHLDFEKIQ